MANPTYTLTDHLLVNITQIERFYGQIEALKVPHELEIDLTRRNLIKSSYASNRIEGNPLTLPEVTNLILDDRVPVNRDEKEVVNYFNILKKLDSYREVQLNLELVMDLHAQLLKGVDKTAGQIRDVMVVVGKYKEEKGNVSLSVKHNPPFHKRVQIEKALVTLFEWLKEKSEIPIAIRTGLFHHQFVYLHPFEDGNGRVCRLLTALLFIKSGYLINKYFVLDDYYDIDRQQYSDALHSADNGDKTIWLEYYSDGVKYSLQSALAKFKNAVMTLKFDQKPTPKEREVLEIAQEKPDITSGDIVARLKVSRQQAHNLLRSLVEKKLLTKKGITKNSFYSLGEG
jgi:Fic family protein